MRFLLAATVTMSVSTAPAFASSSYTSIVSFGDSLSDVGNVFIGSGRTEPAEPYDNGRFSNGPIWIEDLAAALGLPPPTPSLEGGTDFAWGDATTGYSNTNNADVPNLVQQVLQFTTATGGHAPSNALYTFSIGANDLFNILDDHDAATAPVYAAGAASFVAREAGILQSDGAKDLVLFDVPNLGLTPAAAANGPAAVMAATQLSAFFDQQVLSDLAPVEKKGLKVFDLDTFSLIDSVVADPAAYGFLNVTDPCYVGPVTGGGTKCKDPNKYLFWDDVHPTARAGEILAEHAFRAVVPEPATWVMMAIGFATLGFAGLRVKRAKAA